jgi:hypothetical protein
MKNFFKIVFWFFLFAIIIISIGGGGIFLAKVTSEFMSTYLGLAANSYWAIMLLAVIFLLVAMLLIPIVLLVTTKFKRSVVFISFKFTQEDKAIALETQLKAVGFGTERLAFSSNYSHDEVISKVREKLQKSDVLVAIPDAENASFVDSEVFAASVLKIPIILIQYQEKQSQPGTLLQGYPVFDYKRLEQHQFIPLFRFLFFATRSYKDFFNQTKRIYRQMFEPYMVGVLGIIIGIFLFLKFCVQFLRWLILDILEWQIGHFLTENDELFKSVLIMLILGFMVYSIGKAFYTLSVARQVVVTGKDSFSIFEEEFSFLKKDKEMLACIQLNTLAAKGKESNS